MKIKDFLLLILLHFINTNILFSYDNNLTLRYNTYQSNQAQQIPNQSNQVYDNCLKNTKSNPKPNNPNKIIEKLGQNKKKDLESFKSAKLNIFELCFSNYSNQDLFEQYHMYSNQNYLNYICRRPGYENFILNLQQKIRNDKGFQKSLRKTPGFDKNGFADFIDQEANRIRQQREKQEIDRLERLKRNNQNLNISKISPNNFNESFCYSNDDIELSNRFKKRKEALSASLNQKEQYFDYSNQVKKYKFTDSNAEFFNYCYGSMMDKQLHEELCEIRQSAMNLQTQYHDENVEAFSGMILHFTALAKVQPSANVAFHLSDFSHYLLKAGEILVGGTALGLKRSINPIIHPIDDFFKPLGCAGIVLGLAIFESISEAITSPLPFDDPKYRDQINIDFTKNWNNTLELSNKLFNYIKENPKEGVATIVEFLVPVGLSKFAKLKKVSTTLQNFKKITQASEYFEIASNAIKSVANPIKTVLRETAETLKLGLEHGKDALRNVIQVIKGEPELVTVGDLAALNSSEHFKDVEKLAEVYSKEAKIADKIVKDVNWTSHGYKHFPQKGLSWKQIIKSTANGGKAKYHPNIKNIEVFERNAWKTGTYVTNGKNWKVKALDFVCGAYEGKETKYMRVECSAGAIHGHPISEAKYKKLLKLR